MQGYYNIKRRKGKYLKTLYNYIEKELFIELTKKHLTYNKL